MKSFKNIRNGSEKFFPGLWEMFCGIIMLVFWESLVDLFKNFVKHWKNSKSIWSKGSTIFAGLIILSFLTYGLFGIGRDLYSWWTSEWRAQALFTNYEMDIKSFFDKYNERFQAHDCAFMAEVGSDEAMFDKYGRTTFGKDYRCESFVNFQEKILIPFEIQPIVQTGNRYRTKGKLVVLGINQGQPIKFDIQYFELWKELDWPLWHINNPKSGPRKINSEPFVF